MDKAVYDPKTFQASFLKQSNGNQALDDYGIAAALIQGLKGLREGRQGDDFERAVLAQWNGAGFRADCRTATRLPYRPAGRTSAPRR